MRPAFLSSRWLTLGVIAIATAITGCVISRGASVEPLDRRTSDSTTVESPVKAHLSDGSTVVFADGATVIRDSVFGRGVRYGPVMQLVGPTTHVPLDSVIGMETFRTEINGAKTVGYSLLTTAAVLAGGVGLACAMDPKCFGSCPTIYADSAGTPVLEAEGFSYSIAPLLEARDIDRLRTQPDSQGIVRLQVWNEALETHYINHLALVEATHAPGEMVLPDEKGRPVAVAR